MADAIVSCPGCSKRYSVPDGTPPGQFQCQDCGAAVAYGGAEIPAAAPAAPGASAPSSRPSRGRGGRKGRSRRRAREEEPEETGRRGRGAAAAKKQDPTPWILGIVVVALLAFIGIVMANKGKDDAGGTDTASTEESGGKYTTRIGSAVGFGEEDDPAGEGSTGGMGGLPGTTGAGTGIDPSLPDAFGGMRTRKKDDKPLDTFKRAELLPEGGHYGVGVDELRTLLRENRGSVVASLAHLPDTPADLQSEIDGLITTLADPYAGREAIDAAQRLVEIGRPSIPKLLSVFATLDFTKFESMLDARDPCIVADAVDLALRDITSKTNITKLQYNPRGKLRVYDKVIDNWFVWWLNTGYERAEFPKIKETWEDEEEL